MKSLLGTSAKVKSATFKALLDTVRQIHAKDMDAQEQNALAMQMYDAALQRVMSAGKDVPVEQAIAQLDALVAKNPAAFIMGMFGHSV